MIEAEHNRDGQAQRLHHGIHGTFVSGAMNSKTVGLNEAVEKGLGPQQ